MKRNRDDHGGQQLLLPLKEWATFPWQDMLAEHREIIVRDFCDVFTRRAFSLTCSAHFLRWYPTTPIWKRENFIPSPIQMLHALGRWAPWGYILRYLALRYRNSEFNNEMFNLYAGMIREGRDALALQCLQRGEDEYPPRRWTGELGWEYRHMGLALLSYRGKKETREYLERFDKLFYPDVYTDIKQEARDSLYGNMHYMRTKKAWHTENHITLGLAMRNMLQAPMGMECYDPGDVILLDWSLLLEDPVVGEKCRSIIATQYLTDFSEPIKVYKLVNNWVLLWPHFSTQEQRAIRTTLELSMTSIFIIMGLENYISFDLLYRALETTGVSTPTLFDLFHKNGLQNSMSLHSIIHWGDPDLIPLLDFYHRVGTLDLTWMDDGNTTTTTALDIWVQECGRVLRSSLYNGLKECPTRNLECLQHWFKTHPFPGSVFMDKTLSDLLEDHHTPRRYSRDEELTRLIETK
jgi:hypothetical protein